MFSLFAFIHLANAQEMMQSESLEIDAFVERLEANPASSGTWHVLNSSISHTFAGRISMKARWIEESELSPKLLQDMHNEALYIYPNYIPQTHADLHTITERKAAVVGQIPTEALENCDTPLPLGRLYTTGIYDVTEDFVRCMSATRLYLNQVNRIDVPLSTKSFGNLHTITVDDTLDEASVQNLLPYVRHLTVLGTEPPQWLLDNIASIEASSLRLPEVKKLSASNIAQLAKFNGQKLFLNGIQSLSKREAQAFESFKEELQLKGLKELKPAVFAELITGRHRVHIRIDDVQPAHLKSVRGGNLIVHGVTEITATDANAIQTFNGTLTFPDLEHITPEAYMHLLWGSKETIEQTTIPEWKRKQRRITIPFENIAMTTEWVQTILFLESHFWQIQDLKEKVRHRLRWLSQFGEFSSEGLRLMMQNTSTDDITKLNSLQRITPEVAELIMGQYRTTDRLTLELDGLQSIDDESLAILANGRHDVTLNGIRTLSLSQVNILANRDSNTIINLGGLEEMDSVVWGALAPLKHIHFPFWLKQQPEYVEHHFNRKPTGPYNINFSGVSTELFKEIDFSQVERLNLRTLDVFTPTHVNHLSTFAFTHIDIPAHLLTRDTITALGKWPHRNTIFNIEVKDTPIDNLNGLENLPVDTLLLGDITTKNPDLGSVFAGTVPNIEVETTLPIQGVEAFKGESLSITRYRDWDNDRYSSSDVNELINAFQGKSLTVGFVQDLTPELADTIMTRQFNLRIHADDLLEDREEDTLKILQQAEKRNLNYTLHIEGLEPICYMALGKDISFDHINESELCVAAREQLEALEYWENHDCGEHDSGEH